MTKLNFKAFTGIIALFILSQGLFSQITPKEVPPKNDRCMFAIEMQVGDYLSGLSNEFATVGPDFEIPKEHPGTCILTFENDMWYSFKTVPEFEYYQVTIVHQGCNTPAGLQALIIQGESCEEKNWKYRACSNKENEDTIKLFLKEPQPGLSHIIYVDGFDGTICNYSIELKGIKEEDLTEDAFRYVRYDYDLETQPEFLPVDLFAEFINNEVVMEWEAHSEDAAAFFLVEIFPRYQDGRKLSDFTKVVGIVNSENLVAGGSRRYRFVDFTTTFQQQDYCYRIVAVDADGKKSYSKDLVFQAKPIKDFYLGIVKKTGEKGMYAASFVNKKKKADYVFRVLNESHEVLQQESVKKLPPIATGYQVDMNEFEPGKYYLEMESDDQKFRREFFVDGQ